GTCVTTNSLFFSDIRCRLKSLVAGSEAQRTPLPQNPSCQKISFMQPSSVHDSLAACVILGIVTGNVAMHQALVVILPIFEDRKSASQLIRDLAKYCPEPPYIIAIDDGSLEALTTISIADAGLGGEVIKLVRNMGHQRAIAIGICYVAAHH